MRIRYAVLFCVLLSACNKEEMNVETLLDRVYLAHGVDTWDSIQQLSYEKESTVYDADGNTKLRTLQKHEYEIMPSFQAEIEWTSGKEIHRIAFENGRATKLINEQEVISEEVRKAATESINAALYTVSQPFKLRDPGVTLTYEGTDVLENGMEVHVVKADYNSEKSNHTKSDEWWYYFDVDNYLCRATMVHHGSTYSYIRNLSYDESTGVVLNAHRKGYAVDSTRKTLYFQSEYFYRSYRVE